MNTDHGNPATSPVERTGPTQPTGVPFQQPRSSGLSYRATPRIAPAEHIMSEGQESSVEIAAHAERGFARWDKRIIRWSRWITAILIPLFLLSAHHGCGFRKSGIQIGLRDGAFIYESRRNYFKGPMPPRQLEFYTSDYYSGGRPSTRMYFRRSRNHTELCFPFWLPLAVTVPITLVSRRRPRPAPLGPYRVTLLRYLAGAVEYAVILALLSATLIAAMPLAPFPLLYFSLGALAVPFGAYVAARKRIDEANYRFPGGFCRNCLYNLTGNISGVCPECGTKTPHDAEHQIN